MPQMRADERWRRANDDGASIASRFARSSVRNLVARTASRDPILFSHLAVPAPTGEWSIAPPLEEGFAIHVIMAPLPKLDVRMEGYRTSLDKLTLGDIGLYDLSRGPATRFLDPLETMRIQISQRTLDELAYDQQQKPIAGLRANFGENDPVLYGLCSAVLGKIDVFHDEDALFLDHVGLAFYAHISRTYGQQSGFGPLRGGLSPRQFQRARDLMTAKLSTGVSLAELAEACGLSSSYFARAFRRSAGMPAHRWLMNARINRAKELLLRRELTLAEISFACGFADQSHFTRVFSRREGAPPAHWRRLRLVHGADDEHAEAGFSA